MRRAPAASAACLLAVSAALAAAPAARAAWFAGDPVDGPNPDVVALEDLDVARDGTGALVYLRRVDGIPHVFVSRLAEGVWRAPERVDAGIADAATDAVVATADGGRAAVAFVAGGRLYGTVIPAGPVTVPVPAPAPLYADPDPSLAVRDPAIDMGINGAAYVTFTAPGGGGGDVGAFRLQDATWSPLPAPLDIDPAAAAGVGTGRSRVAVSAEGNAVAVWGEGGAVHGRRLTGTSLSLAPQRISVESFQGAPGAGADQPDIDIEDDGSFAWVVFRQEIGGVPHSLARRLRGSLYEDPVAIDGGQPSGQPRIDMSGRGAGAAVAAGPTVALGSVLARDAFAPGTRLDALGAVDPVVAASERLSAAVAWLGGDGVRGRHKPAERPFEPETPLARAELGGVGAGQYDISGSRLGDFAVAMAQGPDGARAITVAHYDRPPGRALGRNTSRYVRRSRPELRWRPGLDLWGPQTFRVLVDGTEIGRTTEPRLQIPRPLADGPHRWQVIAVDRRGQEAPATPRLLRVDSVAPDAGVTVSGVRRAGRGVRVTVRARDAGRGSGVARILVDFGDRSAVVPISRAITHRYARRGAYRLAVRVIDRAGNVTRVERRLRIRG